VTDAIDFAVSTFLHRRVDGELAPISYYCRLFNIAERKYSTYEKVCLAARSAELIWCIKSSNSIARTCIYVGY
jgi:hypothetical protein